MKHRTRLIGFGFAAAAAICCATCAPNDPPETPTEQLPATTPEVSTEQLPDTLAPQATTLRDRLEAAIDNVRHRDLLMTNGFWTIFHGILGLGPSVTLYNPETNERVNALDHIFDGGELRGLNFIPTKHGLDVQIGPSFVGQGHQDQFISEMGQWNTPLERKVVVHGKDYTFRDFYNHAKMRASLNKNQELSWTITLLSQFEGTNVSWTNMYGEKLHFNDVVRYEMDATIEGAACGGTHRLFGLTWAYHLHLLRGGKKEGIWVEVAEKLRRHIDMAKKNQNADGSLSSNFFKGPGSTQEKQPRIYSTGHTLEWLALAMSDKELSEPWVEEAANALALMLLDIRDEPMEGGALYHAMHGVLIYYARRYDARKLGPLEPLVFLPPESMRNAMP